MQAKVSSFQNNSHHVLSILTSIENFVLIKKKWAEQYIDQFNVRREKIEKYLVKDS
jgi:hypothetical protein